MDLEKLLSKLHELPAMPASIQKIGELSNENNASFKELSKAIEGDPIIASRMLQVVNSSFYGLSQKVTSISQAIVVLGSDGVKNLALSMAIVNVQSKMKKESTPINPDQFWLHSFASATAAKFLATKLNLKCVDEAFVCGLLHDIGKYVLMFFEPDLYKYAMSIQAKEKIPLQLCEEKVFGINHAEFGAKVCEKWGMPEVLTTVISGHHKVLDSKSAGEAELLISLVKAANGFVKLCNLGDAGNAYIEQDFMAINNYVEVSPQIFSLLVESIPAELEEISSMFHINTSTIDTQNLDLESIQDFFNSELDANCDDACSLESVRDKLVKAA